GLKVDGTGVDLMGGASGSGVFRVQIGGDDAVLKVTSAGEWQDNARRELTFYQTLAEQVPVATPRLLRYADNDRFTALVLSAHGSVRPAHQWERSAWLEVARQLAALHSVPPPDGDRWTDPPARRRLPYRPALDLASSYWCATEAAASVRPFLDEPEQLARALRAIPVCFVHGDCHVENLLRDGERIVWTDWQMTGVGCSASELAFLWSRATADGADVPYDAMLREYLTHRPIEPAVMRRALLAAEIDILLFDWPRYVALLSQQARDRLTRRLFHLIDDWHTHSW
ncbi:MAG TPA: aminoglycoside phosphotransferase family protein, partial [Actinopolymorphaceae bacterium]